MTPLKLYLYNILVDINDIHLNALILNMDRQFIKTIGLYNAIEMSSVNVTPELLFSLLHHNTI